MIELTSKSFGNALIIDTHPLVFSAVRDLLNSMESFDNIFVRNDILSSLELLDEAEIDFIILDIEFSRMDRDGFEFLRLVRRRGFLAKVLYLAQNEVKNYSSIAQQLGANGCIYQSEDLFFIKNAIEKVCQGYAIFKDKN